MAETKLLTGGCQCGAVRYRLERPPSKASVCFCRMCQKAVGNYFGAFASAALDDIVWTKGTPGRFSSSEVAERGFCSACGTPLTFSYRGSGRMAVTAGSLDDPSALPPTVAYGMESRMPWFDDICRLRGTRTEDDVPVDELPRYRSRQHPDHDV